MPDPLEHDVPLPIEREFHPLGFPLVLRTDSEAALAAAVESWTGFPAMFGTTPLEVRVRIAAGGQVPSPPVFRAQAHLLMVVADAGNFAACDHTRGLAFIHLTEAALKQPGYVRYYFLEAAAFHLLTQLHVTPVHAAAVEWKGRGLLLCGESGAGKSCLAYACARAGFTYVSDNDSWQVRGDSGTRMAGDPRRIRFRDTAAELFPELRGAEPFISPVGKRSIGLPGVGLAGLRTAFHTCARGLAFLKRNAAGVAPIPAGRVMEDLLATVPAYEPDVSGAHQASLERLARLPAFELGYGSLEEGVDRLKRLAETL